MQTNFDTYYKIGIGKQYYITSYQTEIIIVTLLIVYSVMFYDLYKKHNKIRRRVFFNEE